MTKVVTYSLRNGEKRSDQYYKDIAVFEDEVITKGEEMVGELVHVYMSYLAENEIEAARSFGEYAYELLTLGVLWKIYLPDALGLNQVQQQVLSGLVWLRRNYRGIKPAVDRLRGVLGTLFLLSKNGSREKRMGMTAENLGHLLNWLEAAGDFKMEVKRLGMWQAYVEGAGDGVTEAVLKGAIEYANWFETRSEETLGKYTPNVEKFLAEKHSGYSWREDFIFCGRRRVEYHLTMVGIEIMNQAFREDFLNTEQKVLMVPPCMRANQEGCEAVPTPLGDMCMHCVPNCRVHQTTLLGEKHGFKVLMLPNSLSVLDNGEEKEEAMEKEKQKAGVVGVSCPLTVVTGGWEVKAMDVPVQGLLLDYCGCVWHWNLDEWIITDINLKQLLKVMDVEDDR